MVIFPYPFGTVPSRRLGMSLGKINRLNESLRVEDMSAISGLPANEIDKYLAGLEVDGRVVPERWERGVLYRRRAASRD